MMFLIILFFLNFGPFMFALMDFTMGNRSTKPKLTVGSILFPGYLIGYYLCKFLTLPVGRRK